MAVALLLSLTASACSVWGSPGATVAGPEQVCDGSASSELLADESTIPDVAPDVRFQPGDPVAEIVTASPDGTVFLFSTGTYQGLSIQPNSGQVFIGESGVVLAGDGVDAAFRSAKPDVTIANLEITGYEPAAKAAVIQGDPGAKGWAIVGNEIHDNAETGIDGVSEWQVTSNSIHHNGRYGVTGSGSNVVVEGNEIFCNATDIGPSGDSGGTKFVHTDNLVLRGNNVHDNFGNGLWVDINNRDALVEDNELLRNVLSGILLEISCGGVIRSNTLQGNGFGDENENWMSGAAIAVALTPGVEVYDNTLTRNAMGIGGIQWDHGNVDAVSKCEPRLENLNVHDNQVSQAGGAAAGIDAANFKESVWTTWGNTFSDNRYDLTDGAEFRWGGSWTPLSEWQAMGQG